MFPRFTTAGFADQGRRRPQNEDACLTDRELGLAVVADGMGGHRPGHIASAIATAQLRRQLTRPGPLPSSRRAHTRSPSPLGKRMADTVRSADARVRSDGAGCQPRSGLSPVHRWADRHAAGRYYGADHHGDIPRRSRRPHPCIGGRRQRAGLAGQHYGRPG